MAGVALFDAALVAYPLYQTSRHILDTRNVGSDDEVVHGSAYQAADRWLTFWMTFGLIELVQGFGADGIPGFHMAKTAALLSLYSVEHATLIGALLPRACASYIQGADRTRKWWSESAIPSVKSRVRNAGWMDAAQSRVYGMLGWTGEPPAHD